MRSGIFSPYLQLLIFSVLATVTISQWPARQLWCVAKNNAEDGALQSAIDWACGQGGADCGPIQNAGPCYDPSDLQRTASYAFNDYYHKRGGDDSCIFSNTAALTDLNPSHNTCKFPSSSISTTSIGNLDGPVSTNSGDLSSSGEVFIVHLFVGIMLLLCGQI